MTAAVGARHAPRTGARRTIIGTIRLIPSYVKLLFRLLGDRRVSALDKFFVGAAIAYVVMPIDFIPDFIPFLGQVDDIFLLMLALQRLISHAGMAVLAEHWDGDLAELRTSNLRQVTMAASFFLPRRIRRRLRRMAGRSSRLRGLDFSERRS